MDFFEFEVDFICLPSTPQLKLALGSVKKWNMLREKIISAKSRVENFAEWHFEHEYMNLSARNSN